MLSPHSPPSSLLHFLLLLFIFLPPSLPAPANSLLRWTSPHDPCYHLDGRPRHCLSEFINTAYGMPVRVGEPRGGPEKNSSLLTDLHNPHNLTCLRRDPADGDWTLTVPLGRRFEVTYISLQFCQEGEPPDSFSISILKSMDHGHNWKPMQFYSADCLATFGQHARTVALTRHQETEPLCSDPRPLQKHRGGVVLAFSTLDGRPSAADLDFSPVLQDWVTATDIRVVFHQLQGGGRKQEVLRGHTGSVGETLRWGAESKNEEGARAEGGKMDKAFWGFEEKEVRTKTMDRKERRRNGRVKISSNNITRNEDGLLGSETSFPSSSWKKQVHHWLPCQDGLCDWSVKGQERNRKRQELRRRRNHGGDRASRPQQMSPSSLSAPPTHPPLSLSDLQVGGRCKCNGHASRCHRDNQGKAACQCEHHTAGVDCDACKPFYYDRPWQRATPTQPHPCVPCECNGHSTKCRFSMEVYQQSGRQSGGVCLKCRHHTAGRHCQFCQSGYARDGGKPLSHRKACQPCQCHPMGAVGRWCNQSTGQCLCREGVTGLRCNRCAPGYKQGRSPLRPCLRIQEIAPPTPVYQPQYSIAEECLSYCQPSLVKVKMNLDTYCLKDYVLKVQVRGMERSGPWWQFSVWVQSVFRVGSARVRRGQQALWVPDRDLGCGCPALQVGRTFLLIGAEERGQAWAPGEQRLVADRSTLALQWREHWSPKLRGFRGQDKRGKCPTAPQGNSTSRPKHAPSPAEEYTPPHLEMHKPPAQPELCNEQHTHHATHTQRSEGTHRAHRPHKHAHKAHKPGQRETVLAENTQNPPRDQPAPTYAAFPVDPTACPTLPSPQQTEGER
ncbi:netrin-1 [Denticeps clupeoides]|uniref:Netrin-1-like n=1 Tax=Denticeps clupeoides TaxID=299321 RepID=A0AAY4AKU9_9TELE|nr:netrin-1-like [Denticeps clupeoides]XP_028855972.1 netrin-1-like [Denticeps clupeoides]